MTKIRTFDQFVQGFDEYGEEQFDNRDEWYVLIGAPCTEYSINTPEGGFDIDEDEELPPEHQNADENVEGFYQIGHVGFHEDAFVDEPQFIQSASPEGGGIKAGMFGLLLVHEDNLSDEVLSDFEDTQETEA